MKKGSDHDGVINVDVRQLHVWSGHKRSSKTNYINDIKVNTKEIIYIILLSNIEKTNFTRMRWYLPTMFPSDDCRPWILTPPGPERQLRDAIASEPDAVEDMNSCQPAHRYVNRLSATRARHQTTLDSGWTRSDFESGRRTISPCSLRRLSADPSGTSNWGIPTST